MIEAMVTKIIKLFRRLTFDRYSGMYVKSYALFAEDAIIQGLASRYNRPVIHYIDVGANQPIWGNATFAFYEKGGRGVLIEPNSKYVKLLQAGRKRDKVMVCAVSEDCDNGKEKTFYNVVDMDTRSGLTNNIQSYYSERGLSVEERIVPCRSLNSILDEVNDTMRWSIDYISVDVEGYEYVTLKDFDFRKWDIAFFNIEKGDDSRIIDLMEDNGYEVAAETPSNWIFSKKGLIMEVI